MYRLDRLCFEPPFRFDLRAMRRYASAAEAIVPIAEAGDELAGFAIVNVQRREAISSGYVTTLDVHPDHRRRGLAHQLMRHAEVIAVAEEITYLRLHVFAGNYAAIAFYEKEGFTLPIPEPVKDFYGDGLDALVYVKNLIPHRA